MCAGAGRLCNCLCLATIEKTRNDLPNARFGIGCYGICGDIKVQSELIERIRVRQPTNEKLAKVLANRDKFKAIVYSQRDDGLLLFRGRICVPRNKELR